MNVLLLYPPEQNWPETLCKPNGSLAYPMLGGALRENDIEVDVYDACVGNDEDNLNDIFYKSTPLSSGMLRTGVSDDRIMEVVDKYDIIGITSIFSHQETIVLNTIKLIKKYFPEKFIMTGGVNARARMRKFLEAGVDIICTSEAEHTIVDIVRKVEKGSKDYSDIPFVAFMEDDKIHKTHTIGDIIWDLDELPLPAWDLLPNERYWEVGRPHGGHFKEGTELKYASMMTSLGCPFNCSYCHIADEVKGSISGEIGRFRIKSDDRVIEELKILKDEIGVKQVFVEDDSIFGKKRRAIRLLNKVMDMDLEILDVNGVNVVHLLKKGEPDEEVIELLKETGFTDIVLAFESANDRIIRKWASNKWDVNNSNVRGLIESCKKYGLRVVGNYMIGYPDETRSEILKTIKFAKECMEWGLDASNFFLTMPLPGTPMFDECIEKGWLPKDYDPDKMQWTKANMKNTEVPPEELEDLRQRAWQEVNLPEFKENREGMVVSYG